MNSELKKQVSLINSNGNLILILALLSGITWFVDTNLYAIGLQPLSLFSFVIFCVIAGSRKVIRALEFEIETNVWDAQRLSQIRPFPLIIGKVIGPALHSWIIGLLCLTIYFWQGIGDAKALKIACIAILSGIACHTLALTYATLRTQQNRVRRTRTSLLLFAIGISFVLPHITDIFFPAISQINELVKEPSWYGSDYSFHNFLIMTLIGVTMMTVLGAYRVLCMELQIKRTPTAWVFFVLVSGIYISGFFTGDTPKDAFGNISSCSCLVACVLAYLTGLTLQTPVSNYSRMKTAIRQKNWKELAEESPLWLVSVAFAILLGAINTMIGADPIFKNALITNLGTISLVLAFITFRDLLLLSYLRQRLPVKANEFYFIVILGTMNIALPSGGVLLGGSGIVFSNTNIVLGFNLVFVFLLCMLNVKFYQRNSRNFTQQVVQKS